MPDITPNLGIKKPLGNENVSRASFNENWDILDENAAPKNKAQMVKLTGDDGYAPVPVATDLNNLLTSGFYYGNNLGNAPEGSVYHRIVVMMSSATSGIQEATTNGGNRYIRNITRDRGNHRLKLDKLDELPSAVMKQVKSTCSRVRV